MDSIVQRDNKFTFNPYSGVSILLDLAHCRLKDGGRVVFWLPTAAKVDKEEVVSLLSFLNGHSSKRVVGKSIFPGSKLEYVTTECEELNDGLWRWLCVFKKRNHDLLE